MNWKSIRLELAQTKEFSRSSASRVYLLRLPLNDDGSINGAALDAQPVLATVRRFWPNQPDISGYVIKTPTGWAFSYDRGDDEDGMTFHLQTHILRQGEYVTVTEPDGTELSFRVIAVVQMN